MKLSPAVKIAALASLLIALFEMPDEFYKILRFVVLAGAIFTIWDVQHSKLSENWKTALMLSFSLLGIIFNPVLPLEMERSEWRWFNLLGALMLGGILGYEWRSEIGTWWKRVWDFLKTGPSEDVAKGLHLEPTSPPTQTAEPPVALGWVLISVGILLISFVVIAGAITTDREEADKRRANSLIPQQTKMFGPRSDPIARYSPMPVIDDAIHSKQNQNSASTPEQGALSEDKNALDGKEVRKALPVEVRRAIPVEPAN